MVFSTKVKDFMLNKMCIDISIYENKIIKDAPNEVEIFRKLGDYLLSVDTVYMDEYLSGFADNARKYLNTLYSLSNDFFRRAHPLIIAFKSYRNKGQLSLYINTETDSWAPLTRVTKSLRYEMDESDIKIFDKFEEIVTIYRGTGQTEVDNGDFEQSWTIDIEIAKYFAYDLNQEKAETDIRVVLKAQIHKSNIYAYSNHNNESLCIVESKWIMENSVKIIESKKVAQFKYEL